MVFHVLCSPQHRLRSDSDVDGKQDPMEMSDSQKTLIMGECEADSDMERDEAMPEGLRLTAFSGIYYDRDGLLEDWRGEQTRPFAPMDPSVTRSGLRHILRV